MKIRFQVLHACALLLVGSACGTLPLHAAPQNSVAAHTAGTDGETILNQAQAALNQGFPHAVLHSLRKVFESDNLSPEQKSRALTLLIRAELATGNPGGVLALTTDASELAGNPEVRFWRAAALVTMGQASEAREEFSMLAQMDEFPRRDESILMAVPLLAAEGRNTEAEALLSKISKNSPAALQAGLEHAAILIKQGRPDAADKILLAMHEVPPAYQLRHNYLLARARHDQADYEGALLLLGSKSTGADVPEHEEVAVLRASALSRLGQNEEAIAALESYLLQTRGGMSRAMAFALLESLLPRVPSPSLGELRRMVADTTEPARSREAAVTLAAVEMQLGRPQAARELLDDLFETPLPASLELRALILAARLELGENNPSAALQVLMDSNFSSPEIEFWKGCALLALQRYAEAVPCFRSSLPVPELRLESAFNGLLAIKLAGSTEEESAFLEVLQEADPGGLMQGELQLQVALEKAKSGGMDAPDRLRDLAPLLDSEAGVPLAEWLFVNNRTEEARAVLDESGAGAGAGAPQQEARAYLEFFLADEAGETAPDAMRAEELGRAFLRIFPESPRALDVKLKLGEIEQRNGNYLAAYDLFSDVANEAPDKETASYAWFLAGRSASRLMDSGAIEQALLAFEEAAQAGGEVAARARYEQALLFNAQGNSEEAVILLDRVAADTKDFSLRAASLIEKGDAFYAKGSENPEMFRRAIEAWHPLVEEEATTSSWRDQALTKTGLARMRLGENDMALENFYSVILAGRKEPGGVWFERAGFEACRLLEERQAWAEAVRLYQLLAEAGGPRAAEAATRANRVRLENFLWEG